MKNYNIKKYDNRSVAKSINIKTYTLKILLFLVILFGGATFFVSVASAGLFGFDNVADMFDGGGRGASDPGNFSDGPFDSDTSDGAFGQSEGGGGNWTGDGGSGFTAAQVAVMLAANTITNAEALAMSARDFNALTGAARVSAEVARARATGREVTYSTDGSVSIEVCTNGRGGEWSMPDRATPEPENGGEYSQGSYYSQSSYGSCTPGVDCTCQQRGDCPVVPQCTPGVDCTCVERNDCTITAELEALVADFTMNLGGEVDIRTYSSRSRDIFPNIPIWLRWRGYDQDGNPADSCVGIKLDDFTAPKHLPLGRFVDGSGNPADGGAGGVAGVPYPGLADGANETYEVRCSRLGAVPGSASVRLRAVACTLNCPEPPIISVNNSDGPLIVRYNEEVKVAWSPLGNKACTLSAQIAPGNNANVTGEDTVVMTGETTFSITCENGSDSVSVRVLPRVQET